MLKSEFPTIVSQRLAALCPDPENRFAIAYSGGGDSTALLHSLKKHPQLALVLIVDHGLRIGSREEAIQAADFAKKLGLKTQILTWQPKKITSGIQEKARRARYGLLGQACRENGIEILLTAHSRDDQAETVLMRYDRGTDWRGAAGMQASLLNAVWPELEGISLIRPLLGVSRKTLRDYNVAQSSRWVDDPSNENRNFSRIRARDYLRSRPPLRAHLLETVKILQDGRDEECRILQGWKDRHVTLHDEGYVTFDALPPPQLLYHIIRCVSGLDGHIPRVNLQNLRDRMAADDFKAATLGGAKIERLREGYLVARNMRFSTRIFRKNLNGETQIKDVFNLVSLSPKAQRIWDRRYKCEANDGNWQTIALCAFPYVQRPMLSIETQQSNWKSRIEEITRTIPQSARASLPLHVHKPSGRLDIGLMNNPEFRVKSCVQDRLNAFLQN